MEVTTNTSVVSFDDIMSTLTGEQKPEGAKEEKKRVDFFSNIDDDIDTGEIIKAEPKADDKKEEPKEEVKEEEKKPDAPVTDEKATDAIIAPKVEETDTPSEIDKLYKELVKREAIIGYNDDKPITTVEELQQLIEDNRKLDKQRVLEEELPQFVESLPDEVQAIVKYASEGGKDLKSMFKALLEVEEFREIQVKETDVRTQEDVAYKYLKATGYAKGKEDKIRELIDEWKDNDSLFKRAKDFKVELDEMHEKLVAQKLQEQEKQAEYEEKRAEKMKGEVYQALVKEPDLNGLKLDKQTQGKLFTGLTSKAWKSTQDGRPINLMDALIEYYTYHEPNYKLVGEALYLLLEPDNYKKKVLSELKQKVAGETQRVLRTEQSKTVASSTPSEKTGLKRPNNNFWK